MLNWWQRCDQSKNPLSSLQISHAINCNRGQTKKPWLVTSQNSFLWKSFSLQWTIFRPSQKHLGWINFTHLPALQISHCWVIGWFIANLPTQIPPVPLNLARLKRIAGNLPYMLKVNCNAWRISKVTQMAFLTLHIVLKPHRHQKDTWKSYT